MNVTHHRFSIGFNTFILVTTASSRDVTAINMLMNSLVLACKWSIVCNADVTAHKLHVDLPGSLYL